MSPPRGLAAAVLLDPPDRSGSRSSTAKRGSDTHAQIHVGANERNL
eukprot:CAMPEP_0202070418 /NCGR_PEP_ID=MMETSP0964-20121228/1154_1 /ASSEMBLY_ACC=CAM_ASM_000500 /TAXON_ID=4773 /ORGANISM="Schizochytrium aggregatum, Strain ATCC28209" /LENGTH=45 /DNA_ID= /DNA_START= /DNA_END= /DNA_ORIENTATION=